MTSIRGTTLTEQLIDSSNEQRLEEATKSSPQLMLLVMPSEAQSLTFDCGVVFLGLGCSTCATSSTSKIESDIRLVQTFSNDKSFGARAPPLLHLLCPNLSVPQGKVVVHTDCSNSSFPVVTNEACTLRPCASKVDRQLTFDERPLTIKAASNKVRQQAPIPQRMSAAQ